MDKIKKILKNRNIMLIVFCIAFVMLYVAANNHYTALGIAGISLTVLNAVVVLLT